MFILTETYDAVAGSNSTGLNIFLGIVLVVSILLFAYAMSRNWKDR